MSSGRYHSLKVGGSDYSFAPSPWRTLWQEQTQPPGEVFDSIGYANYQKWGSFFYVEPCAYCCAVCTLSLISLQVASDPLDCKVACPHRLSPFIDTIHRRTLSHLRQPVPEPGLPPPSKVLGPPPDEVIYPFSCVLRTLRSRSL